MTGQSNPGLLISIILATRNRADDLARAISSICTPGNLLAADWELIVVDNGSSDRTKLLCCEFQASYPRHFRLLVETARGKSNAVNAGLRIAVGEFIALIDDDVICQPDYMESIRSTVRDGFSDIAQGRIFVDYHSKRPAWFDEDKYFDQMMLLSDLGDEPCELGRSLWGANVIMPFAAIAKVGGYCPELGAGANGFGEDAELGNRLRRANYRLVYVPEIVVRHQVSGERLGPGYILRRSFEIGRCSAYYSPFPIVPIWRYGLYALKEAVFRTPSILWALAKGRRGMAIRKGCDQLQRIGWVIQMWRFRKTGPPPLTVPVIEAPRQRI
jgi:glucosyl-dolichyl phosphate glucuronosyltransferase